MCIYLKEKVIYIYTLEKQTNKQQQQRKRSKENYNKTMQIFVKVSKNIYLID